MGASMEMIRKLEEVDPKVREAFLCLIDEVEAKSQVISIGRGDFNELKDVVQRLAEAQDRTEQKVGKLAETQEQTEQKVGKLAEAQERTEQKVGELAEAQERTEQKVGELAEAQNKLTQAQDRTEERVEELAEAQVRTEKKVEELAEIQKQGFHSLTNQIAALGSRWGIYNEGTFRSTIRGLLSKMKGVEVREGYYGDRQIDVIIRNGEHVMLEITSRMHAKDIKKIYSSADDYKTKEGIEPSLMVATSYISPKLMEKVMGLERKIEIFSYESEE